MKDGADEKKDVAPSDQRLDMPTGGRRDHRSKRRADLHVGGVASAPRGRHGFGDQALPGRPFTADPESGEAAEQQQLQQIAGKGAQRRADAVHQHRHDDRRPPAEAVPHEAEDHAAERRHRQRQSQRQRGLRLAQMQVVRDRHDHERVQNEIVKVENPRREAQRDNAVVNRTHRAFAEQRDRCASGRDISGGALHEVVAFIDAAAGALPRTNRDWPSPRCYGWLSFGFQASLSSGIDRRSR